jgi:AraC family transcriptional regulator of adaptative response / DNA-3-methyladenine glycosylase II
VGVDLDAARCYRALLSRDRRFDGRFFVGVTTTGIYCRPICPSPPPRPKNVRFYACAAAAQADGFRPCLRCRPESAPGTPAWEGSPAVVRRALRLIAQGGLDDDDVEAFASRLGVGGRQLRRLFEAHLGASPAAVARASRAHFARRLLDETDLRIADVAFSAGFRGVRQFNQAMRAAFHAAPRELRARRRRNAPGGAAGLTLRLAYRPPLDWDALLGFLALRATPGVERVDAGGYRRTLRAGDAVGTLAVIPEPKTHHATLVLSLPALEGLQGAVARVRRLLDLDADPLRIGRQLERSSALAGLVKRRPGLRVPGAWDGFELAVRAVLGQQVSVRGATTLAGRLVAKFGEPLAAAAAPGLTHLFPAPAALAEADVAAIGLPRARAEAIRALARAVADGRLVLDGGVELAELVAQLCAIPGVGSWTAHYVAMRACGETDAFPAEDLGLRRAFGSARGPASTRALLAASEAWRPFRAYAALHLWTGSNTSSSRAPSTRRAR